jgi:gas vesicle structural protein
MSVATTPRGYLERPRPSGLADVIEVILDKGMVIDVYVRVALIGIEILTIDARIVIASVDTYLRFAEAVNRLDIAQDDQSQGLPQLIEQMTSGGAESKTKGAIEGVKDKLKGDGDNGDDDDKGALSSLLEKLRDGDDDDDQEEQPRRRSRSGGSSSSRSRASSSGSGSSRSSGSRSGGSSSGGSRSRSRKRS